MTRSLAAIPLALAILIPQGRLPAQETSENIRLTVFAAASLNEAFREIASKFHEAHPGCTVVCNFAGSQQLVQQLTEGARADVFASADTKQMDAAVRSGRIDSGSVRTFVRNRLVIIAPHPGARVTSVGDLARSGIKVILADRGVPAGRYALQFLDRAGADSTLGPDFRERVLRNVVSYEENVRAVLSKVVLGEADAGVVYVSDLTGESRAGVDRIDIPDRMNIVATYPIAILKDSPHQETAGQFLRLVLSREGQSVLGRFGFIGRDR